MSSEKDKIASAAEQIIDLFCQKGFTIEEANAALSKADSKIQAHCIWLSVSDAMRTKPNYKK